MNNLTFSQILHPVKWSYAAKRINVKEYVIMLKADIEDGWHIYSVNQKDGGPKKTSFKFTATSGYSLVGKVSEPPPMTKFDNTFEVDVSYFNKSVIFQQKIVTKNVKEFAVAGKLEFMVCNDHQCLPPETVEFNIPVK
ncbi:protein-disulfide reductase DsbD N-terminal domain-containing protein [Mucilaginibacter pineti]|nr:protein-disulfide reductase DsbD N-terminal domain-containing protein [Mucilaginibacter pineti]